MRSLVVRVTVDDDSLGSLPVVTTEGGTVERGSIQSIRRLGDGTVVQLRAVAGDLDRYRRVLQTADRVIAASVTGTDAGHVVAHYEPPPLTATLLNWLDENPIAVDPPIEFEAGAPVFTLVGPRSSFSTVMERLPEPLSYEVHSTGGYTPMAGRLFGALTARQREVLATAIDCGYYANPREATHEDLAGELALSAGTVGDHLRSIEERVFAQFDRAMP